MFMESKVNYYPSHNETNSVVKTGISVWSNSVRGDSRWLAILGHTRVQIQKRCQSLLKAQLGAFLRTNDRHRCEVFHLLPTSRRQSGADLHRLAFQLSHGIHKIFYGTHMQPPIPMLCCWTCVGNNGSGRRRCVEKSQRLCTCLLAIMRATI